jgi:chromosome segregation ATPase
MKTINVERVVLVAVLLVTSAGWAGRVEAGPARSMEPADQQAAPSRDVLPELLAEVKGLRAALEQMASAGPRVQLFAARLQLQETRINNLLRRLDTVRDRIDEARREVTRLEAEEKQLEAVLTEHKASSKPDEQEEANMATMLIGGVKAKIASSKAIVDRHTAEEAQLATDLAAEQGRWMDINRRLDELELLLVRK